MSVRLMNLVYEARFRDVEFERVVKKKTGDVIKKIVKVLAPNLKSVCLALADHANDEGEGAYPSITRLESKTELSRPTVIACLKGLQNQGIASNMGLSRLGTCNYTLSMEKLTEMTRWEPQKRRKTAGKAALPSKAALPAVVKPLPEGGEAALLKPSINHTQPSVGADAPPPVWGLGWQIAAGVEKVTLPDEDEQAEARLRDAVGMFAPAYQELARAFILATDIYPLEKHVSGWSQAFKDQQAQTGLAPEDVTEACRQMLSEDLTVKDPFSVMNKVPNIRSKRKKKAEAKKEDVGTEFSIALNSGQLVPIHQLRKKFTKSTLNS